MRILRSCWALGLAIVLMGDALGTADDDPADEKNWLIEKSWPAFVASRHLKADDADDRVTKLLKERFNAGQDELRNRYIYWLQGSETLPQVYDAARRVVEARLEVGGPGSERLEILKEKLAFAKIVEQQSHGLLRKFNHANQVSDIDCAAYYRASSELELLRAERTRAENRDK